jgi:hypothetical protein
MKPHLLTPQQVYHRKERGWRPWSQWHVRIVRVLHTMASNTFTR